MNSTITTVRALFDAHPFYKARLQRLHHRASQLNRITGPLTSHESLALETYLLNRPERFFNRECFAYVYLLLQALSPTSLLVPGYIATALELDAALRVLRRTNRALGDPRRESYTDERRQHALQEDIFPDYARLAEYSYGTLVGYVAELQALARGKPYGKSLIKSKDASPLRSRWEIAKRWLPPSFHECFHPNIRNAIIHANIAFDEYDVRFTDPSGPEIVLALTKAEDIAAELLDVCNAIAAAITAHSARVEGASQKTASLHFLRTQRVISSANTDLLQNESCFESQAARKLQIQVEGTHAHWTLENLFLDIMRALVYAKHHFSEAEQVFVTYADHRRSPSFYSVPATAIPDPDEPIEALPRLVSMLGKQGLSWIEHEGIASAIVSKFRGIGSTINWIHAVPVTMSYNPQREPEYELREILDISVGVRERFRAVIVSEPREIDLTEAGSPTEKYLAFIFQQSLSRWLFRRRQARPLGAGRLRLLQYAVLEVHRTDRRLRRLRDTGLQENFLFRFEWSFGTNRSIALLGSKLEQVGPYTVTVNASARPFLCERAGRKFHEHE